MDFHVFVSNEKQNVKNIKYPNTVEVACASDLAKIVVYDHAVGMYENSERSQSNFLWCDVLFADLDNTHHPEYPDDSNYWKSEDDIADLFPDVDFYYSQSRSHMKIKKTPKGEKKEARPKLHFYFPLSKRFDDKSEYNALYEKILNYAEANEIYLDKSVKDVAQFFYAVPEKAVGVNHIDGSICIDQFSFPELPKKDLTKKHPKEVDFDWIEEAEQQNSIDYVDKFINTHGIERTADNYWIDTENHPRAYAIPVRCPWEKEHSEDTGSKQAVIIVDRSGKLNYLCRHGHCKKRGWKDYKGYYINRSKKIEDKWQEHKAIMANNNKTAGKGDCTEEEAVNLSCKTNIRLQLTEKGDIKSTFFNYCEIVERDNYLKGKIKLNLLSERPEAAHFFWNTELHTISDSDYYEIRRFISKIYNIQNKDDVKQAINRTACKHSYHPVRNYLSKLRFEGNSMIEDLFPKYLGAKKSTYTATVTKVLLSGMIERVFNPGCKFDLCIILADTKQGTGKSTMVKFLSLKDEWFSDSLKNLDDDKRLYEQIRGRWCIELGEMLSIKRAKDVEGIKSFLSKQFDDYREPYGTYPERRLRQCVFIGTTNKPEFLPEDKTGNRRFVPLLCDGDLAELHPLQDEDQTRHDIEQCFAEMMEIRKEKGDLLSMLTLPKEVDEELSEMQEQGTPEDERVGMIQEWLNNTKLRLVCTRMIWDEVLDPCNSIKDRSSREAARWELRDISDIMNLKVEGWRKKLSKSGKWHPIKIDCYGSQRAWERIPEQDYKKTTKRNNFVDRESEFAEPIDFDEIPFINNEQ